MSRPFRVSKPVLIAAGVLLAMPLVVSAQPAGGPHIEPGLWETGIDAGGVRITSQICMDGSEASSRRAFTPPTREEASTAARNCEKQDIHPIPGGYSVNTTCTNQGGVTHISGTVAGDFRTRYTVDMTVERNGRPPQPMHMESHRVGACPAGMRPGEARTQIDQGSLAAAIAAARARAAAGGQ